MRRTTLLLLGLLVSGIHASIFCPHTSYPSTNDEFVVTSIQGRQRPGQEAYYRIANDNEDPAYQRKSSRFHLMTTRDSGECPFRGCLVELSPAEPKNHGTLLYQTSVIGKMIPPGFFAMDVGQRFYCVVTDGDCGATIPLYRHYRWAPTGIFHAYTLESDATIEGYTREATPLCYVWAKDRPQKSPPVSDTPSTLIPPLTDIINKLLPAPTTQEPIAEKSSSHSNEDNALIESDDLCEGADQKAFDSSMKKLKEYHNGALGAKSDHYYTTKKPNSSYKAKSILGKVITNAKNTNCKCLVQLSQMKFESDDKNVLDHKLVRAQIEPITLYQYKTSGEEIYCARKENACGATVPLRKFYNLADADSVMTANDEETPFNSSPSPAEVLCWIWPKTYHQDSTEEELKKENMNVIKPTKSGEESTEVVEEGSGAEIQLKKPVDSKKVANDDPKPQPKPVAKKAKKEKKSKKRSKKPKSKKSEEVKSTEETKSSENVDISEPKTSIESEEQFGGKILKFENVNDGKAESKGDLKPEAKSPEVASVEEPKSDSKSSEDTSLLDSDEEKVREFNKFQNKHSGKEPTEIEEQQDDMATVLHFEDVASH